MIGVQLYMNASIKYTINQDIMCSKKCSVSAKKKYTGAKSKPNANTPINIYNSMYIKYFIFIFFLIYILSNLYSVVIIDGSTLK